MRIRKRSQRVFEAARAAAVVEDKIDRGPETARGEVPITASDRSKRLIGGGEEAISQAPLEERSGRGDAVEEVPKRCVPNLERREGGERGENGNGDKKEEASPGAGSELLMKSLLVVFERAGIRGLTAREAVAKLAEYDLPGLQEGERSSVQVAKVLRTPDFVHLEDGKYFIYPSTPHAVVAESSTHSEPSHQPAISFQTREDVSGNSPNFNNGRRKRAANPPSAAAKLPTAVQQKENTSDDDILELPEKVLSQLEKVELKKRRRRPPSSQHELAIGPRQCKRYDGRGWQCTKETEEGFSFCEHHQALMNKRTIRLNLAKMRRKGGSDMDMGAEPLPKAATTTTITTATATATAIAVVPVDGSSGNSNDNDMAAPHGIEDLIHNQRRSRSRRRREGGCSYFEGGFFQHKHPSSRTESCPGQATTC